MKRYILYIGFLLWSLPGCAQMNLDSLQGLAAKNNPQLKTLFYRYRAALKQIPIDQSLPDPQLMFGYMIAPQHTAMMVNRFTVSASQSFPWFGTKKSLKNIDRAKAEGIYYQFLDRKEKLFQEVAIGYYRLYAIEQKLTIHRQQLQLLQSLRKVAHTRYINGTTSLADVLAADMRISKRKNRIKDLSDQYEPALKDLAALTDTTLANLVFPDSLKMPLLLLNTETGEQRFSHNNRLLALNQEVIQWKHQQAFAKKSGAPHFSIGVGYMDMEMMGTHQGGWMFPKVGLSIPLYRKKYKAMKSKAQLRKKAVLEQKKNLKNQLNTRFYSLLAAYKKARRNVKMYAQLQRLSNQARQILTQRYSNGSSRFEEVLKRAHQSLDYSLSEIDAQMTGLKSYYEIQYLYSNDL